MNKNKTLYTPELEHDSCGIGFVAHMKGEKSHTTVRDALLMLRNMEHRGACGADPETGDGSGILIQIPDQYYREECAKLEIDLPPLGEYGVGMMFFPQDEEAREECRYIFQGHCQRLGFDVLGYRPIEVVSEAVGIVARSAEPHIEQVYVRYAGDDLGDDPMALERKLFVLRNYTSHWIGHQVLKNAGDFYFSSFSARTVVYKGQMRTDQVGPYYPELADERVVSALALVHSRFSTNTMPAWKLAQPFRFLAHNGEINTIRGNVNWMKSKEAAMKSTYFSDAELELLLPICNEEHSDSANLDSMVELLLLGGRPLPMVMMMLVPEAWQEYPEMEPHKREFYEFYSSMMEPWDGPASICFTDGELVGATLDRNGLRPSRYCVTSDDRVIMASEAGALPVEQDLVVKKGRLQPGRMFVIDMAQGRIISDEELKKDICQRQPYGKWLQENKTYLDALPKVEAPLPTIPEEDLPKYQQAFGFTSEDLKVIIKPMAENSKEPIGSMGMDTPLAVLSDQSQHISSYFKQLFAQVSNPPIDPIRERLVMSLRTSIGPTRNVMGETPEHCKRIGLDQPILTNRNLLRILNIKDRDYVPNVLDMTFDDSDPKNLERRLDAICHKAEKVTQYGANILVLSHREAGPGKTPIPSLLAAATLHHHLINTRLRNRVSIVVEAGDVWETHHVATLVGYGVNAVNPYMAFATIEQMRKNGLLAGEMSQEQAEQNFITAIGAGLLKIFSKMGISTLQSYHGAQIFEIVGINRRVVRKSFNGTVSRLEGLGYSALAKEAKQKMDVAFGPSTNNHRLEVGGVYAWRRRGERHQFSPETIHLLQKSTRLGDFELFQKYAEKIDEQGQHFNTLRGLLDFRKAGRKAIPLEQVEPVENIFKRFATGAMSFGSISHEAHSTLAIAMNRIGGRSNSGEGGEDPMRFEKLENGDWMRSAIKQVASGRFGVTSHYLSEANELQIKIAQGAKPGEGGQLPGHKVDDWIGRVRHSTPGVGLISPPPHHDIYSIEDLAQLIHDLKNANREARINVKLVSEAGVGTIASGVSKAHADVILVSGYDGGTGASPLSSLRHAGLPWELGLSEAHQTLVQNDLRSRVTLQTDGQIKTGRDIAVAILLGAEEFGVSTAALVTEGCIMMRKCHLNTCPVGVATQNPELRKLFTGKPEHVVNLFTFLAEDLRRYMARLGYRTVSEMVGQTQHLRVRKEVLHWKAKMLDFAPILAKPSVSADVGIYKQQEQDHELEYALDWELLQAAKPALEAGTPVERQFHIVNVNRSVGTILSNEVSKAYGAEGLPDGTIDLHFRGSAGQSFGAFGAKGIRCTVEGEANDYFGKGLSGAELVVHPDRKSSFKCEDNIIIGNVAFYGGTSGRAFINGQAGERFCVRNSGVTAVVEGVGDHGCEYMTGGLAVILGDVGRNFGAGMSGGRAFVYDPKGLMKTNFNPELADLEALTEADLAELKTLVEQHHQKTQSNRAAELLADWPAAAKHFCKVMPRDYKRVMAERQAKAAEPAATV